MELTFEHLRNHFSLTIRCQNNRLFDDCKSTTRNYIPQNKLVIGLLPDVCEVLTCAIEIQVIIICIESQVDMVVCDIRDFELCLLEKVYVARMSP